MLVELLPTLIIVLCQEWFFLVRGSCMHISGYHFGMQVCLIAFTILFLTVDVGTNKPD